MKSKQKQLKLTRGIIMIVIGIALIAIGSITLLGKLNYHIFYGQALMAVTYSGGMCSDGPCKSAVYNLYDNGSFEGHKKLTQTEVANLKQLIDNTDFTSYGQKPNPNCMSFRDGADRVLIFPKKHGNQKFTVCKLDVPSHDSTLRVIDKLIIRDVTTLD